MCLFCSLSTPSVTTSAELEAASLFETLSWFVGGCLFLFILYRGYQNTRHAEYNCEQIDEFHLT